MTQSSYGDMFLPINERAPELGTAPEAPGIRLSAEAYGLMQAASQSARGQKNGISTDGGSGHINESATREKIDARDGVRVEATQSRDSSGFNGTFAGPDGKDHYRVVNSRIFDQTGKQLATIGNDGNVSFESRIPPKNGIDINACFNGWIFHGEENGRSRIFATSADMANGTFWRQEDGKPVKYDVHMGMMIDSRTGEQYGLLQPPGFRNGRLEGGYILRLGAHASGQAEPLSKFQNAVFDLDLMGQTGRDHRPMRGVVQKPQEMTAEGKPVPGTGLLDLQDVADWQMRKRKVSDQKVLNQAGFFNSAIGYVSGANKEVTDENRADRKSEADARVEIHKLLATGVVDAGIVARLSNMTYESKKALGVDRPESPPPESESSVHHEKSLADEAESIKEPHCVELFRLTGDNVGKVNGLLRIDDEVYRIKDGALYRIGRGDKLSITEEKVGSLGPGYTASIVGRGAISLSDENRVLMKFRVGDDLVEHAVLGTGRPHFTAEGDFDKGGLVDVNNLRVEAISHEKKLNEKDAAYLAGKGWVSGDIANWLKGDSESKIEKNIEKIHRLNVMTQKELDDLFAGGFDVNTVYTSRIDSEVKSVQVMLKECGVTATTSEQLLGELKGTQLLLKEGGMIGVTTLAATAATVLTDGLAEPWLAANAGRLASLARVAAGMSSAGVTSSVVNVGMRYESGQSYQTIKQNAVGGFVEGTAMGIPIGKIDSVRRLGAAALKYIGQTSLMIAGAEYREHGDASAALSAAVSPGKLLLGSGFGLLSHLGGQALARLPFLPRAIAQAEETVIKGLGRDVLARGPAAVQKALEGLEPAVRMNLQNAMAKLMVPELLAHAVQSGGTGFTFGGLNAMPQVISQEKQRIARELHTKESDLTYGDLLKYVDYDRVSISMLESGLVAGLPAMAGSPFTHKLGQWQAARLEASAGNREKIAALEQTRRYMDGEEIGDRLVPGFTRTALGRTEGMMARLSGPLTAVAFEPVLDRVLRRTCAEAREFMETAEMRNLPPEKKLEILTRLCNEKCSPSEELPGGGCAASLDQRRAEFFTKHAGERVLLGSVIERGLGGCMEESMLLKYLCDELLPDVQTSLVRGNGTNAANLIDHTWVVASFGDGSRRVFDPSQGIYNKPEGELASSHKSAADILRSLAEHPASQVDLGLRRGQKTFFNNRDWKVEGYDSKSGDIVLIREQGAERIKISREQLLRSSTERMPSTKQESMKIACKQALSAGQIGEGSLTNLPAAIAEHVKSLPEWEQIAARRAWDDACKEGAGAAPAALIEKFQENFRNWTEGSSAGKFYERTGDLRRYIGLFKDLGPRYAELVQALLESQHTAIPGENAANPFQLLQRFKPKEFMEAFRRLNGAELHELGTEEARKYVESNENAIVALKLTQVFGKSWEQWVTRTNALGLSVHEATHWLPLTSPEKLEGLSSWLLKNMDLPRVNGEIDTSELRIIARRWNELSSQDRSISRKELMLRIRAEVYVDVQDSKFAVECARWGIKPSKYKELEALYLASLDVPSPFPLNKAWCEGEYQARFLPRNDPKGLFLGEHTSCCQHPEGAGASCAYHGQESINGGFFVVEDKNGKILSQSWAWVSDDGGLCFDNIEGKQSGSREAAVKLLYQKAARDLTSKFHTVSTGEAHTKVHFDGRQRSDGTTFVPLSPPRDIGEYRDSKTQVVISDNPQLPRRRHDEAALVAYLQAMKVPHDEYQRASASLSRKLKEARNISSGARRNEFDRIDEDCAQENRQAEFDCQEEIRKAKALRDEACRQARIDQQQAEAAHDEKTADVWGEYFAKAKELLERQAPEQKVAEEKAVNDKYQTSISPYLDVLNNAIREARSRVTVDPRTGRPNALTGADREACDAAIKKARAEFDAAIIPLSEERDRALKRVERAWSDEGIFDAAETKACEEIEGSGMFPAIPDVERAAIARANAGYDAAEAQAREKLESRKSEIAARRIERKRELRTASAASRDRIAAKYGADRARILAPLAVARKQNRQVYYDAFAEDNE